MTVTQDISLNRRFWSKVESDDWATGCWVWTGAKDPAGYGRFSDLKRGKARLAHHWAWYFDGGREIPKGLGIDQLRRKLFTHNERDKGFR